MGATIVWLTGHGQEHELVYPTSTPFAIHAQGYEPCVMTTTKNFPSVIWERPEGDQMFVWMCSTGYTQWVSRDRTGRNLQGR